jgi:ABC-type lipoprotein release transport system permease subunit
MQSIAFKMLFRKKGTASAILAIALLIAPLTSVNCLLNNINSYTNVLSKIPTLGQTYIITSQDSTSLYDGKINSYLINQVYANSDIDYATSQQIIAATLITKNGNYTVNIRAIDDIQAFISNRQAQVNGLTSQNNAEADIGVVLSQLASIHINDTLNLTINNKITQLKAIGIIQANQQSDTELIMPLTTLQTLTGKNDVISFIEFTLKDSNVGGKAIANIIQSLPGGTKIIELHQISEFAQGINSQTIVFINIWSIAIYTVVVAASYIVASRLTTEAEYDLYMLRTLGARKKATISLVIIHTLTIAFIGLILGISIGIVGTQMAATGLRWLWGNSFLAPFLQPEQVLQILVLALISSIIGSIYPAIKATQNTIRELPS